MPNLNPLVTGDIPYPQYGVTTTQEIDDGVTIIKGRLYTKNSQGELIVSIGTLVTGLYQAASTPTINVPAIDGDEVQVLGPRTRMLLVSSIAGLVEGSLVNNVTNTDSVTIAVNTTDDSFVGRIFEIYTKDANGNTKKVTAIGDLVVVETVGP